MHPVRASLLFGLAVLAACATEAPPSTEPTGAGASGGGGGDPGCDPGATRPCYGGPEGTEGLGVCRAGTETCDADGAGWSACDGDVVPGPLGERCDTPADDDCDGMVNEEAAGCICDIGETQPCYTGPEGTVGVGICVGGTSLCAGGTAWGACDGEVVPLVEDCAKLEDEDCNGISCSAPVWDAIFGGSGNDRALATVVDAAGNTYVTGKFTGFVDFGGGPIASMGGDDVFLVKLDPQGAHLWSTSFGDAGDQYGTTLAIGITGGVVLGGYFNGGITFDVAHAASGLDGFVAELDPDGVPLWSARLGGAGDDKLWTLAVGPTGEVLAAGSFNGTHYCTPGLPPTCKTSAGGDDVFARLYTPDGALSWVRTFGSAGAQVATGAAIDSTGALLLGGHFESTLDFGFGSTPLTSTANGSNVFVVKMDPTATSIAWAAGFGDSDNDQRATALAVDHADQPIIAGTFEGSLAFETILNAAGSTDVFVAKLSVDGAPLWSRGYGNFANQSAQRVAVDPTDNVVVTGGFEGVLNFGGGPVVSGGAYDLFVLKLGPLGDHLWSKGFGNVASQFGFGVATDPTTSQVVVTGYAAGAIDFGLGQLLSAGAEDIVVARFQP